jgi:hypothetical protein
MTVASMPMWSALERSIPVADGELPRKMLPPPTTMPTSVPSEALSSRPRGRPAGRCRVDAALDRRVGERLPRELQQHAGRRACGAATGNSGRARTAGPETSRRDRTARTPPRPSRAESGGPLGTRVDAAPRVRIAWCGCGCGQRKGQAPTSKRAKRATSSFSPTMPWTSLIACATVLSGSMTNGWFSRTQSS